MNKETTMKQQRSWQNITHAKQSEIYQTLCGCRPGERWLVTNQHLIHDVERKQLSINQALAAFNKTFRFMMLYDAISGKPSSLAVAQQRNEQRLSSIRIKASRIAVETGVRFEKVFSMLVERMNRFI